MNFLWKKKKPVIIATEPDPVIPLNDRVSTIYSNESALLSYKVQSISETGPSRQDNEDSIVYFYPATERQTLFAMVADGMGGHNAGEVASNLACQAAKSYISRQYTLANSPAMLEILMQQMHQQIRNTSQENSQYAGMGTTAVALFIKEQQAWFASVGDSRIYHYTNNKMVQLTTDQTLVNQMISEGKITPEEGLHHEMKHVLLQALGTVVQVKPELSNAGIPLQTGDKFFLCSDGIYDMLSDAELTQLIAMPSISFSMEAIKALCMQRRARDNFSAILIEVLPYSESENNLETKEQNIFV
jgi:serine/threonine protein phosphatase PrpC